MMSIAFNDLYSIMKDQEDDNSRRDDRDQYPAFTSFKYDSEKEKWVKKTTDYIFMAKNRYMERQGVIVEEFMDPVDLARYDLLDKEDGYPSYDHPSDHFSIAYKIYLK